MNDLPLRPPVPFPLPPGQTYGRHARRLQPHLSVLLVTCRVLRLSLEGTFTGACLLHRYALRMPTTTAAASSSSSDKDDAWRWRVASLVFLACKTEEEHRRLRDLINLVRMMAARTEDGLATTTTTTTTLIWQPDPPALDDAYWKDKERLVQAEQAVLRGLAFDVHVAHPHRLVVLLAQDCLSEIVGVETSMLQDWVPRAWRLLNASVWNVHALQQPTLALAVAALDEAIQMGQPAQPPPPQQQQQQQQQVVVLADWWKETGVSAADKQTAVTALRQARGVS
jgi:hypothetical protein